MGLQWEGRLCSETAESNLVALVHANTLYDRAVVLESGLGLESGLKSVFLWSRTRWYSDSDLYGFWSRLNPGVFTLYYVPI